MKRIILPALPTKDEDFWPNAVIDSEGHVHCPCCGAVDSFDRFSWSQGGPEAKHDVLCGTCDYVSGDDYGPAEEVKP